MTYKLMLAALATALVLVCGCETSDRDAARTRKLDSPTSVVKPSTDTKQDPLKNIPISNANSAPQPKAKSVEAQWGNLSGTFIYDGDPPTPMKLRITKDMEFCGKHDVIDESLIVNKQTGGLANVIVFLYQKRGSDPPPVHPSYDETANAKITLDNDKCRFEPHVLVLRTSQTLVVGNLDQVGHNTKIDTFNNAPINPTSPAGSTFEHRFTAPERRPAAVGCSIHPWMSARVLVRDDPYFVVTDENGQFEIKNLPAGEWTFQVWHEKGAISQVARDGKTDVWKRGRFTITIEPGENDLGEIKVSPKLFE